MPLHELHFNEVMRYMRREYLLSHYGARAEWKRHMGRYNLEYLSSKGICLPPKDSWDEI